jgi:anti-sigma regulatory factor (Ser/Thr protein kinase)
MNTSSARILMPSVIPTHPSSPYNNWQAAFPLRSFLELGAYDTAPGSARGHVRNLLGEWRLGHLAEAALLVLSELLTNSVIATSEARWEAELPPVRLWVLGGTPGVLLLVWDAVADDPRPRQAGMWDEGGRGLFLVQRYSASWDCYPAPVPPGGKVTRALISKPCPPDD